VVAHGAASEIDRRQVPGPLSYPQQSSSASNGGFSVRIDRLANAHPAIRRCSGHHVNGKSSQIAS
jgi:hypothetical protein